MKVWLAPDAFKGSLSATEAANALAEGLRDACPGLDIIRRPMADGGEGTLAVLAPHLEGEERRVSVDGMDGRPAQAVVHAFVRDGEPAWLVESAQVVGLNLPAARAMPLPERSTAPLGRLLRAGIETGVRRFEVALGGSGVHDGGIGLMHALGARFLDMDGRPLPPRLDAVERMASLDVSGLVRGVRGILLLDVDNPLLGEEGALAYARQKGADEALRPRLERWMRRWADLAEAAFGRQARQAPGAGAAGGLGFALMLLGMKGVSGARAIAERTGLDACIEAGDWVVTGEGQSDAQTLRGKAPMVVARLARERGARVALISGRVRDAGLLASAFDVMVSAAPPGMPDGQAMSQARALLRQAASRFARLHLQDWLQHKP